MTHRLVENTHTVQNKGSQVEYVIPSIQQYEKDKTTGRNSGKGYKPTVHGREITNDQQT